MFVGNSQYADRMRPDNRRPEKDMRNVSIFQPGISGKWKARPGMFGNKRNERGNGIQQPPWNATLFSLLKWEVRNRHKQLGNQPRKQSRGFAVYM